MDEKGLTTRADWLTACRRATDTMRTMLADRATTAERAVETGTTGQGGDHTLEIDDAAETATAFMRSPRSAVTPTSAAATCWS
jgi:hypothetical protein